VVAVAVEDLIAVVMELQSDAAAASPELELKMGILLYICLSGGGAAGRRSSSGDLWRRISNQQQWMCLWRRQSSNDVVTLDPAELDIAGS
jgi:hypothetical protein